ncbi:MAG: collagen-like protein [Patescibacteria group bacterium]
MKHSIHMTDEERQSEESLSFLQQINDKEFPKEMEVSLKGVSIVTLKGEKGDKGDVGEVGEKGEEGKSITGSRGPRGDKGVKGERGEKGESIIGSQGKEGRAGKDGSPDNPDQIIEKINSAKKKISWKQIKDVPDFDKRDTMNQMGYTTGMGDLSAKFFVHDLSSQVDGSLKEFTIPQNRIILNVQSTQFPIIYRPTTDYTISGVSRETLTFTAEVGAVQTGQTLIVVGLRP